ncbi:hypothetical protein HNR57_006847 [Streptomyces paradoxus]|uniref:Uncharacterized protein n=1 Tax=Streptomyces paradoxus TaxID=66375 RepID=A0A7W9TIW7_9ACTN|nr:hypothetical protein [Streptomyces paradoxus]
MPSFTATVTVRFFMRSGLPSTRYDVGSAGSSVSWWKLAGMPVETVWLHATCALNPMEIAGVPNRDPPDTFSSPGIVCCDCQNRRPPSHG